MKTLPLFIASFVFGAMAVFTTSGVSDKIKTDYGKDQLIITQQGEAINLWEAAVGFFMVGIYINQNKN